MRFSVESTTRTKILESWCFKFFPKFIFFCIANFIRSAEPTREPSPASSKLLGIAPEPTAVNVATQPNLIPPVVAPKIIENPKETEKPPTAPELSAAEKEEPPAVDEVSPENRRKAALAKFKAKKSDDDQDDKVPNHDNAESKNSAAEVDASGDQSEKKDEIVTPVETEKLVEKESMPEVSPPAETEKPVETETIPKVSPPAEAEKLNEKVVVASDASAGASASSSQPPKVDDKVSAQEKGGKSKGKGKGDTDQTSSGSASWGDQRGGWDNQNWQRGRRRPRPEWICGRCPGYTTNFLEKHTCRKCHKPRDYEKDKVIQKMWTERPPNNFSISPAPKLSEQER